MKRRFKIIATLVIAVLFICLFIKIYDTYKTYTLPQENYYSIGESFVYNGLQFELKGIEVCDIEKLVEEYNIEDFSEMNNDKYQYKYFLATLKLTAMDDAGNYELMDIGMYTKYYSDYDWLYPVMYYLNDEKWSSIEINKGETKEYYVLYRLGTHMYSLETMEKMDEDDIAVMIFDTENGCVNFMSNNGSIEK